VDVFKLHDVVAAAALEHRASVRLPGEVDAEHVSDSGEDVDVADAVVDDAAVGLAGQLDEERDECDGRKVRS
jgi:hypothetical protein